MSALSVSSSNILSKRGTGNLMTFNCLFKNFVRRENQMYFVTGKACPTVCVSEVVGPSRPCLVRGCPQLCVVLCVAPLFSCRRVRSGSGMSVISSSSADQRLPEEPSSEDEQQVEKKLPGERP